MAAPTQPRGPSPALRLLSGGGRVVTSRPRLVASGLRHRVRGRSAWALWPDAAEPIQGVDVAAGETSAFMRREFGVPPASRRALVDALRRRLGPSSWDLARAGALLEPAGEGLAARAARSVLGPPADDMRIALFSPSGSPLAKAVCFVLEPGREEPAAVVLATADPRRSGRLRDETDVVERVRERLEGAPDVAAALPRAPLGRHEEDGDFAVVVAPDPLASRTGDVVEPDRERAWRWLSSFRAATTVRSERWSADDTERVVKAVREAWSLLPEAGAAGERGAALAASRLASVDGADLPVCAVHGDFWRGNVAHDETTLRVFDWEWARLEGGPLFDLWTYELSDAQFECHRPRAELAERLRAARRRVERELENGGLAPQLAAAALPGAVAELILRPRRATGSPGAAEPGLLLLLGPVEDVLEAASP
ncbi:MAG TPA: hypothetical protein VF549_09400 [Solirubrobacteraceae bacterium]